MNARFYSLVTGLFMMIAVFAACGGHDTAGTDNTADSVVVPPSDNTSGNTHTFDPPPGDSNSRIRDSLYNADSARRKK